MYLGYVVAYVVADMDFVQCLSRYFVYLLFYLNQMNAALWMLDSKLIRKESWRRPISNVKWLLCCALCCNLCMWDVNEKKKTATHKSRWSVNQCSCKQNGDDDISASFLHRSISTICTIIAKWVQRRNKIDIPHLQCKRNEKRHIYHLHNRFLLERQNGANKVITQMKWPNQHRLGATEKDIYL